MFRNTITICMVASILCLGCEEEKQVIDVDSLPEGTGTGTAGTGDFSYHEVITSSSCPAEWRTERSVRPKSSLYSGSLNSAPTRPSPSLI